MLLAALHEARAEVAYVDAVVSPHFGKAAQEPARWAAAGGGGRAGADSRTRTG